MSRSFILALCAVAGLVIAMTLKLAAPLPESGKAPLTPEQALTLLKEGNMRYAKGAAMHPRQDQARRSETAKKGQFPFATVVGCSDSREPLELLFDQGVGDLFVVRVAGNVAGTDELASVEYGAGHLSTPVVLVLGHTKCGAVTATVQKAKLEGSLPALAALIVPAVDQAAKENPKAEGEALVNKAIRANVFKTMADMLAKSEEMRHLVTSGKTKVLGAIYDLDKGSIEWLGEHPAQAKLVAH
jgi:carbonic anhydrase